MANANLMEAVINRLYWTASLVEERLEEAARVLKRMPPVRVEGYFSVWPTIIPEFGDLVGQEAKSKRRRWSSPREISRMEETLGWTVGLEPVDAKIVWRRAFGAPWKHICATFGISRSTANQRWIYALSVIAWRLNGKPVSQKQSRNEVLAKTRYR